MTNSHTPGPWVLFGEQEGYECLGIEGSMVSIIVFGERLTPDEMYGVQGATVAEAQANARLIAAAPELLEALTALVLNIDAGGASLNAVKDARAAIAKATGE